MPSGESGIRTHAPFRTNGFQDRLVMTTSISLRMCVARVSFRVAHLTTKAILAKRFYIVNTFLHNFLFIFLCHGKAPFYHGLRLSRFLQKYSFFFELFQNPHNCRKYSYYSFHHCPLFPARYNSQPVLCTHHLTT